MQNGFLDIKCVGMEQFFTTFISVEEARIKLTDENASAQARYIIADEAISAGLTGEAKDQLSKVLANEYNTTYHQLKSRLADKSDDKSQSNEELEKALNANPKVISQPNCDTKSRYSCDCTFWNGIACSNAESDNAFSYQTPFY